MKKHYFLIVFYLLLCSSCVKNIDFEQAENLELTPVLVTALINTTIEQASIVNPFGAETVVFKEVSKFDVFTSSEFEKVEKMVIDFDVTNTFDREFSLLFTFIDDDLETTYQLPLITIPEKVAHHKVSHEIIISNSPSILNSKSLDMTIKLLPISDGSIINTDEKKIFKFNSSGTFYLKIN